VCDGELFNISSTQENLQRKSKIFMTSLPPGESSKLCTPSSIDGSLCAHHRSVFSDTHKISHSRKGGQKVWSKKELTFECNVSLIYQCPCLYTLSPHSQEIALEKLFFLPPKNESSFMSLSPLPLARPLPQKLFSLCVFLFRKTYYFMLMCDKISCGPSSRSRVLYECQ
jgi:hypothetical protein